MGCVRFLVLIFAFVVSLPVVSAQSSTSVCTDRGDNGYDIYKFGENYIVPYTGVYPYLPQLSKDLLYYYLWDRAQTATVTSPDVVPDHCIDDKKGLFREFSCLPNGTRQIDEITCPGGCYLGTETEPCPHDPTLTCYTYKGKICNGPDINSSLCNAVGKWLDVDGDPFSLSDNCCYAGNPNQVGRMLLDTAGKTLACIPQGQVFWDTARLKEGAIFKIERSQKTTNSLFKNIELEDDYDIVGNDQNDWVVCDPDFSLYPFFYTQYPHIFSNIGRLCDPSQAGIATALRCLNILSGLRVNDFLCTSAGEREAIFECSADTVRTQTSQLAQNDDYDALVQGDAAPALLALDTATFNRADTCADPSQYCTILSNLGDTIETQDFIVSPWTNYDYLQFNIFVENETKFSGLMLELAYDTSPFSANFWLSNYRVAEEQESNGFWYLIRIPTNHHPGKVTAFKISTQQAALGEIKLEDFTFWGNNVFYCSREVSSTNATATWVRDLDNDDARGAACNAGRFTQWTGTRCCGDDTWLTPGVIQLVTGRMTIDEIYNDTNGVCFFSKAYPTSPQRTVELVDVPPGIIAINTQYTGVQNEHPLLVNGTQLLGCGFSLYINQTTDTMQYQGALPFTDVASCTTITDQQTGASYFCSQNGWSNTSYTYQYQSTTQVVNAGERSLQSYDLGKTGWSCCSSSTCWNGTSCLAPPDPVFTQQPQPGTQALQCINGQWINGTVSFDWVREEYGVCPSLSHCFFDKDAPPVGLSDTSLQNASLCKPNTWYSRITSISGVRKDNNNPASPYNVVADLYCDTGEWSSRTRFIAEKLLTIPQNNNIGTYTLLCDPRDEVLYSDVTGKAYRTFFSNANSPLSFTNSFDTEYFNNLCILSYKQSGKDVIVIGSSYNSERTQQFTGGGIDMPVLFSEAFDIAPLDLSGCTTSTSLADFIFCGGTRSRSTPATSAFYWNNKTQSFIYTPQAGLVLGGGSVNTLYDILVTPLLSLIRSVPRQSYQTQPLQLEGATVLNNIYISQTGIKKITAFKEAKRDSDTKIKEFFAVSYENPGLDICPSVIAYDMEAVPSSLRTLICHTNASTTTVFGKIDRYQPSDVRPLEEFFGRISRSTRLR